MSPTLGPGGRGSRLLVVLEVVRVSSLFIYNKYKTHVVDWWGLQPLPGLGSTVQGWFHVVSSGFGLPAEGFHRSQSVFQGERG